MKRLIVFISSRLHRRRRDACTPGGAGDGPVRPGSDRTGSRDDPLTRPFVELDPAARARLGTLIERSGLAPADVARRAATTDLPGRGGREIRHRTAWNEGLIADLRSGARTTVDPRALRSIARELGTYPGWILNGTLLPVEARGERLRTLREARGWSQQDLAHESGVSVKTIRRLELASRQRPQTYTMTALARTLGVEPDVLSVGAGDATGAAGDPRRRGAGVRVRFLVGAVGIAALLVIVGASLRHERSTAPVPELVISYSDGGRRIDVHDGSIAWSAAYRSPVHTTRHLTWDGQEVLLVVLENSGDDGDALFVHRLDNGAVLVHDSVDARDTHELFAAVGPTGSDRRMEYCELSATYPQSFFMDIDADGASELLAVTRDHNGDGPARLRSYRKNGQVVIDYYFDDTLDCYHVGDFDNDGKDEIVVCGTSLDGTARIVVLDDTHCRGLAPDTAAGFRGTMRDSSLAGLAIPPFSAPYMNLLHQDRMHVYECFSFRDPATGDLRIRFWTHVSRSVQVVLDGTLTPLQVAPSDPMVVATDAWPEPVRRTFFDTELPAWQGRFVHTGAARIDRAPAVFPPPRSDTVARVPGNPTPAASPDAHGR